MLSVTQIIKGTDKIDIDNSKFIRIQDIKRFKSKSNPKIYKYKSNTITRDNYDEHDQIITILDGKPLYESKNVKVMCSCKRFLFYYNWNLYKKGAAELHPDHNGQKPTVNIRGNKTGVCKHLIKVLKELRKNI